MLCSIIGISDFCYSHLNTDRATAQTIHFSFSSPPFLTLSPVGFTRRKSYCCYLEQRIPVSESYCMTLLKCWKYLTCNRSSIRFLGGKIRDLKRPLQSFLNWISVCLPAVLPSDSFVPSKWCSEHRMLVIPKGRDHHIVIICPFDLNAAFTQSFGSWKDNWEKVRAKVLPLANHQPVNRTDCFSFKRTSASQTHTKYSEKHQQIN